MKYFKPEIWSDLQSLETMDEAERLWDLNNKEYIKQLESLEPRLSQRNYQFFKFDSLHDGYVVYLNIQNQNALNMKEMSSYRKIRRQKNPIIFNIEVLSRESIYSLKFSKVTRFIVDSPSEEMLPGSSGLGDWGYSELTEVDSNTFRYEVLFSSGSTLLIEFSSFSYSKRRFIKEY